MLWILAVICALQALRQFSGALPRFWAVTKGAPDRAAAALHGLQETLEAGRVPPDGAWEALGSLSPPWGRLCAEAVRGLRARGAPVLPTLRRLRGLAEAAHDRETRARARASQALGQAVFSAAAAPLFGAALYATLPGLAERPIAWAAACLAAILCALLGARWMVQQAELARWGGLPPGRRHWIASAECAGERFLALVASGNPSDLSWLDTHRWLEGEAPALAALWGADVWTKAPEPRRGTAMELRLAAFGDAARRAIQASLMEGTPCRERFLAALEGLRRDVEGRIDLELARLPNRALRPLFALVAPSLLGLIAAGLWLAWPSLESGTGG